MAALTLPSFLGTPDDQAKVVDAYNEVSSELRTNLSSKITSFTSGLDDAFNKTVGIAKNIGEKLSANTINLPAALRRVQGALAGSRNDILKLATSTEKLIMSELTGVDPNTHYVKTATDVARGLELMVGSGRELIDTFKAGGYNQVSAMVGFISDLTDTPGLKLFDMGAEAAILRGVVEEVSAWGIPSLVDTILKDQPDRTRYAVLKRSAESISHRSNLDTLYAYATVKSKELGRKDLSWIPPTDWDGVNPPWPMIYDVNLGANALNAATPDFAMRVISNFTFDAGTTPANYPEIIVKLTDILSLLKPDWFMTTRGNEPAWNLGTMSQASEDAVTLFLTSDLYRDAILTAPFYRPQSINELVDSMYPLIPS